MGLLPLSAVDEPASPVEAEPGEGQTDRAGKGHPEGIAEARVEGDVCVRAGIDPLSSDAEGDDIECEGEEGGDGGEGGEEGDEAGAGVATEVGEETGEEGEQAEAGGDGMEDESIGQGTDDPARRAEVDGRRQAERDRIEAKIVAKVGGTAGGLGADLEAIAEDTQLETAGEGHEGGLGRVDLDGEEVEGLEDGRGEGGEDEEDRASEGDEGSGRIRTQHGGGGGRLRVRRAESVTLRVMIANYYELERVMRSKIRVKSRSASLV